jgi:hypothetical protein
MEEDGSIGLEADFAGAEAAHFRPADVAIAQGQEEAVEHLEPAERGDDGEIHPSVVDAGLGGDANAAAVAGSVGDGDEVRGEFEGDGVGQQPHVERTRVAIRGDGSGDVAGRAGQAAEAGVRQAGGLGVESCAARSGVKAGLVACGRQSQDVNAARLGMKQRVPRFKGVERDAERASQVVAAADGKDSNGDRCCGEAVDDFVHGAIPAENDDAGVAFLSGASGEKPDGVRRIQHTEVGEKALLTPVGFDGAVESGNAAATGRGVDDYQGVGERVHPARLRDLGAETIPLTGLSVHRRQAPLGR